MALAAAAAVLLAGLVGVQVPPAGAAEPEQAWTWPLDGSPAVQRSFAPPAERYGTGHRGVDLGGTPGAVVRAAGAGRVSYAGRLAGRGVVVVVHGDLRTTYEPVSAGVDVGQRVAAGEPLGTLAAGHAGCPSGACLHWGLRRGEHYLDPLSLVAAGPPRLLPVDADPPSTTAAVPPAGTDAQALDTGAVRARTGNAQPVPASAESGTGWDLRSAATPTGALAVLALLAGLALLVRPRTPPAGPSVASARLRAQSEPDAADEAADTGWPSAGAAPSQGSAAPEDWRTDVIDLGRERARRRSAG